MTKNVFNLSFTRSCFLFLHYYITKMGHYRHNELDWCRNCSSTCLLDRTNQVHPCFWWVSVAKSLIFCCFLDMFVFRRFPFNAIAFAVFLRRMSFEGPLIFSVWLFFLTFALSVKIILKLILTASFCVYFLYANNILTLGLMIYWWINDVI